MISGSRSTRLYGPSEYRTWRRVTGLQGSGGHCLGVKWPKLSFSEGHHDGHGVVAKYSISEVILIDPQRLGYLWQQLDR